MPGLLIVLDRQTYKTLRNLAESDERAVDQQARYLLRRAIAAAVPALANDPPASAARQQAAVAAER